MACRCWTSCIGRFIGLVDAACVLICPPQDVMSRHLRPSPRYRVSATARFAHLAGAPGVYPAAGGQ
ncbi:hypothetical protein D0Q02_03435 [Micromonospora craniellae]|uniref:Uncharacterized protein n=1 Tax=Micromonospora craniellae TaxID=2294034 RepID=A0A372G559_9ACTN|nr:hypothetical protein D0Q02_03435 [Micromonospora craniellae]